MSISSNLIGPDDYMRQKMYEQIERMNRAQQNSLLGYASNPDMAAQASKPATPKEPPFNPVLLLGEDE